MELKKIHWIGIISSIAVLAFSLFFIGTNWLFLLVGISVILAASPFVFSTVYETRVENEKEEMFLEFARNLVESGKTGIPIVKSIINVRNRSYGVLSRHIQKLANQIYVGVPLQTALEVFAKDVNNRTISRAITLIGQAERSGGNIEQILESVAGAVSTSDRLKKERKAVISGLVIQGYLIFFIFIIIILVLQFKIIPLIGGIGGEGIPGVGGISGLQSISQLDVSSAFFYLLIVQGLFSGLAIGKLSEKNFKAGIRHSFILMVFAFMVSSIANFFF
jgi:flagellar protein FlaJ